MFLSIQLMHQHIHAVSVFVCMSTSEELLVTAFYKVSRLVAPIFRDLTFNNYSKLHILSVCVCVRACVRACDRLPASHVATDLLSIF